MEELLIKSKERVEKYGEVFTPQNIVNKMLDQDGVKEMCENLTATFLEPTAGEGVFLVEILRRKLKMVAETYNKNIKQVSNYSLLALSTLYGIELLEDNLQTCVINLYEEYYDFYLEQCRKYDAQRDQKILDSAKTIIKVNMAQGDFLKRCKADGSPIVFSDWHAVNLSRTPVELKVTRTEYSLDEIYDGVEKQAGTVFTQRLSKQKTSTQMSLFDLISFDEDENDDGEELGSEEEVKVYEFVKCKISEVYKEAMEEVGN